ncbi:unnamed protein product, partial [marine sediment metagenome]
SKYLCEECYADSSMQSDIEEWDALKKKGWDNGPLKPAAAGQTVSQCEQRGSSERGQPEGGSPAPPIPPQGDRVCECRYPGAPELENGVCMLCGGRPDGQ